MENLSKYLLLLVMEEIISMAKKLLLLLMLLSMLIYAGCGGGSGGRSISIPIVGAIQGNVSFGPSLSSLSISSIDLKQNNLLKKSFHQSKSTFMQQSVPNEKIVKLRPGLSDQEAANIIAGLGGTIRKKLYGTDSTYLISVNDQTFSKSAASRSSNVEYIEDNLIVHAFDIPNDTYFNYPYYCNWNYYMLNLPKAWDVKKGEDSTSEIIVAVLDTGISLTHPDLAANLVTGYDCVGDSIDENPSDTEYNADNRYSHGAHVAGIISAVTNNKNGIAGVAWNVKIMPIRVLASNGIGTSDDVIEGINHAVANVTKGVKVINLSLGINASPTDSETEAFREAIDAAINAGITVVAAAGNENGPVAFPANYGPVIAESALDETGAKASYSNHGSAIDLCAPGGNYPVTMPSIQMILSTTYDKLNKRDDYVFMSGTSQAAPHISGLAALLYASGFASPTDVEDRLKKRCINLGDLEHYGNGLPDAYAVLTDTDPIMAKVKVFIGDTNGNIISNLQHVGASGSFTFSNLKPGTYTICAFEDINNDNAVSDGETVSHVQVPVYANKITIGVKYYTLERH